MAVMQSVIATSSTSCGVEPDGRERGYACKVRWRPFCACMCPPLKLKSEGAGKASRGNLWRRKSKKGVNCHWQVGGQRGALCRSAARGGACAIATCTLTIADLDLDKNVVLKRVWYLVPGVQHPGIPQQLSAVVDRCELTW